MTIFSNIPRFPEFRRLSITDGPLFHGLFQKYPPLISEYTFTNLFAWMHQYDFQIANYKETLLILSKYCGSGGLYPPISECSGRGLIDLLKESLRLNVADHFHCADENMAGLLEDFSPEIEVKPEPDYFDYVYSREELANLSGNKFHKKKNLLNQFERKYDARFEPLTVGSVEEALKFEHSWCTTRECEKDPGLSRERCAIFRMLSHFEILRLNGAVVRLDGKIIGLTLGEPLNQDTYVVHVEKADESYKGIYQFINQRFAASVSPQYIWINREQDLGIEGLRKAKQSYNPARMGKQYMIRLKT